jgi:hypothetical protein
MVAAKAQKSGCRATAKKNLVMRRVIDGFSGIMNGFTGQSPGGSAYTSKGYFNTSTLRCSL